jgi:phage baseplate assembly protein W
MGTRSLKGISFPFRKGSQGFPQPSNGSAAVLADLVGLLTTEKGEVPMLRNLGVSMYRFVFETTGALLKARITQEVRSVIAKNEPRMVVLAVTVTETQLGEGRMVEAIVDYEIAGERGKLSVPVEGSSGG